MDFAQHINPLSNESASKDQSLKITNNAASMGFVSNPQKEWRKLINNAVRQLVVKKLVSAIYPCHNATDGNSAHRPVSIEDRILQNLELYATKVEDDIYNSAESKSEYYHRLAEKYHKFSKEIDERKKKRKEQQRLQTNQLQQQQKSQVLRLVPKSPTLQQTMVLMPPESRPPTISKPILVRQPDGTDRMIVMQLPSVHVPKNFSIVSDSPLRESSSQSSNSHVELEKVGSGSRSTTCQPPLSLEGVLTPNSDVPPPNNPVAEKTLKPEILEWIGLPANTTCAPGPEFNSAVSSCWKSITSDGLPENEEAELIAAFPPPENSSFLDPPNVELQDLMTDESRLQDNRVVANQQMLGAGLSALSQGISELIQIDNDALLPALKKICSAGKILAGTFHNESTPRRNLILSLMNSELNEVIAETEVAGQSFGETSAQSTSTKLKAPKFTATSKNVHPSPYEVKVRESGPSKATLL